MSRSRVKGKVRVQDWERYRTVLMFKHDYFSDLDHIPTRDELKTAWRQIGPEIMENFLSDPPPHAGIRPWGHWVFDLGMDEAPSREEQRRYLEKHNLLTVAEKATLARWERKDDLLH